MCEMVEMVERVARKLEVGLYSAIILPGARVRDLARAAIAAMREPTDAICNNIGLAIAADLPSDAIWRNAIDEALR